MISLQMPPPLPVAEKKEKIIIAPFTATIISAIMLVVVAAVINALTGNLKATYVAVVLLGAIIGLAGGFGSLPVSKGTLLGVARSVAVLWLIAPTATIISTLLGVGVCYFVITKTTK